MARQKERSQNPLTALRPSLSGSEPLGCDPLLPDQPDLFAPEELERRLDTLLLALPTVADEILDLEPVQVAAVAGNWARSSAGARHAAGVVSVACAPAPSRSTLRVPLAAPVTTPP